MIMSKISAEQYLALISKSSEMMKLTAFNSVLRIKEQQKTYQFFSHMMVMRKLIYNKGS